MQPCGVLGRVKVAPLWDTQASCPSLSYPLALHKPCETPRGPPSIPQPSHLPDLQTSPIVNTKTGHLSAGRGRLIAEGWAGTSLSPRSPALSSWQDIMTRSQVLLWPAGLCTCDFPDLMAPWVPISPSGNAGPPVLPAVPSLGVPGHSCPPAPLPSRPFSQLPTAEMNL